MQSPPTAIPGRFRALVARRREGDRAGPVDVAVEEFTPEDLPAGEVAVRVDWSAVNYKDGLVTRPGNRVARVSPLVPGVDLVGTVVASDDPALPPGREVIVHGYGVGVSHHGGFAEFARVPAAWVVPLPPTLSARRAAVLGTAGFTAALSVFRLEDRGLVPGGGPVLVTGASGGLGSMAVAVLAARGHEVVASTGRPAEAPYLHGLGARTVVDRDGIDDLPERVLGSERWAGAVDCVGGATLARILRSLRYGAAVAASGLTGGSAFESTVFPFITRGVALLGVDAVDLPMPERRAVWDRMASEFPPDLFDDVVERTVGLDELPGALATILEGGVRGRVLVRPGAPDGSRR